MAGFTEERLAPANGIEIAYQEMGDRDAPAMVLIMGLGTQMIAWDEGLCEMLAGRGFRVIRLDNRDIGHSTIVEAGGVPNRLDLILGRRAAAAYLLGDMAADTAGLMDHLGIEAAHVVGVSMGGMIAQTMAIEHPERVLSLTSMMSTTGRRWMEFPTWRAFAILMTPARRGRDAYIEQAVKTFRVIGSPGYPMDEERLREVVARSYDRGHRPSGMLRQLHAVTASGDRSEALRRVTAPTLVIHGRKDPLARPVGGRATAKAIPGARLRLIEGMGHDLPRRAVADLRRGDHLQCRQGGSGGPGASGRLNSSALRPHELIELRHVGLAGDINGLRWSDSPMQVKLVARVAEDSLDVVGEVGEHVSRTSPAVTAGVDESTPVGMDQPTEEKTGGQIDQALLPVSEDNLALMLLSWAMLREEAWP